jgi:cobalt-zinc-cadmium efflux system outer membrane protein
MYGSEKSDLGFMKQKRLLKYLLSVTVLVVGALSADAARPQVDVPERQVVEGRDAVRGDLSLDRAIRLALDRNPDLRVGDARKDAALGRSEQARAWPNPELEVFSQDMPASRSRMSQAKHMIGISQTIPWPGKKQADRAIGAAGVAVGEAEARMRRAELVKDVTIAYCQVQTAERLAGVADDLVKVAQAAAVAAGKRNAAGEITLQEMLRAEIQLEQTKADQVDSAREIDLARLSLGLLLGGPDKRLGRLTDALDDAADFSVTAADCSSWLSGHPAMLAVCARHDQAVAAARRAGLESMPDIKVGVAGGRDESAEENLMELRFTFPLPLFDRSKGKRQEAQAGLREAEAEIAVTSQRLTADWRAGVARYQAAVRQLEAHRARILPKSEDALRLIQRGFDEGKFGMMDLLDIQRTTAEARMAYQKKLFEWHVARAGLEAMVSPAH